METVQQWQDWYRKHRTVEQVTSFQDSITNNALFAECDLINTMNSNDAYKQKATEHFADTICEFIGEMTGQELFDCFVQAANDVYSDQQKEYDMYKEFIDAINRTPAKGDND